MLTIFQVVNCSRRKRPAVAGPTIWDNLEMTKMCSRKVAREMTVMCTRKVASETTVNSISRTNMLMPGTNMPVPRTRSATTKTTIDLMTKTNWRAAAE